MKTCALLLGIPFLLSAAPSSPAKSQPLTAQTDSGVVLSSNGDAQMCSKTIYGTPGVKLAPGWPDLGKQWSFGLFGDALYQKAYIPGPIFAVNSSPSDPESEVSREQTTTLQGFNFGWDWGFRAGFNGRMCGDLGEVVAYYTYFRSHGGRSFQSALVFNEDVESFFSNISTPWGPQGSVFSSVSSSNAAKLNIADLVYQRPTFVSSRVVTNLGFGLKGIWSNVLQKVKGNALVGASFQGQPLVIPYNFVAQQTNTFSGLGIEGLFGGRFYFAKCLALFGQANLTGAYGISHSSFVSSYINSVNEEFPAPYTATNQMGFRGFMPIIDWRLGFQSEWVGARNSLTFQLAWEGSAYFNLISDTYAVALSTIGGPLLSSNLYTQSVSFRMGWNF